MVKILGLPFDSYVDKQFKTRQAKLSSTQKSPEEISVFNSNTAWVRLTSGVKVEPDRAAELSKKINVSQDLIQGTSLAKKLVLWGGVSSFTTDNNKVNLDPTKGGLGYSLDTTYGFLSNPEQGLKPPPGITSISCNYKNNGSLKQAVVNIKCYTRSQFEALETIYLRLGYTVVLEWGNTLWFDNNGDYQQTKAWSIPSILFTSENDVDPDTIYQRLAVNKRNTSCNYDGMLGKVTNYSWTLNDDLSFDIKLDLISTGDIIDSLKMNVGGTNTENLMSQVQVSQSIENIVAIQVNKEASKLNAFFYELYEEVFHPLLKKYGSEETNQAITNADKVTQANSDIVEVRKKYKKVVDAMREYYTQWQKGLDVYNRNTKANEEAGKSEIILTTITPEDLKTWEAVAAKFGITTRELALAYGKDNTPVMENFNNALDQVESYFNSKLVVSEATTLEITYYKLSPDTRSDVAVMISKGEAPALTGGKEIPVTPVTDGNFFFESAFGNLLEKLLGLNVR